MFDDVVQHSVQCQTIDQGHRDFRLQSRTNHWFSSWYHTYRKSSMSDHLQRPLLWFSCFHNLANIVLHFHGHHSWRMVRNAIRGHRTHTDGHVRQKATQNAISRKRNSDDPMIDIQP